MGRLSAIFISVCMVLVAASVGAVAFLSFGFTGMEASVVTIAVLTALVIVMLMEQGHAEEAARHTAQDFFLVPYFAAWLARDLFYLQWMKVRPVRSPLRKAFLYLLVFYVSSSIVFSGSITSTLPDSATFSAWLAPFALLRTWTNVEWNAASGMWLLALLVQFGAAAAFAYLYLQQVAALARVPRAAPPAIPPRLSSTPA